MGSDIWISAAKPDIRCINRRVDSIIFELFQILTDGIDAVTRKTHHVRADYVAVFKITGIVSIMPPIKNIPIFGQFVKLCCFNEFAVVL